MGLTYLLKTKIIKTRYSLPKKLEKKFKNINNKPKTTKNKT
jgi:hypothetical protein